MGAVMSKSHVFALGVAVLLTAIVVAQDTAATNSQPQPCSAPEQKQMDFWVGDWDLTWTGNSSVGAGHGTNSIRRHSRRLHRRRELLGRRGHASSRPQRLCIRCSGWQVEADLG